MLLYGANESYLYRMSGCILSVLGALRFYTQGIEDKGILKGDFLEKIISSGGAAMSGPHIRFEQ